MKRLIICISLILCGTGCLHGQLVENIARLRAVIQSGSVDDDKSGHLITDGSPATLWQGRTAQQNWVYVDLGAESPVSRAVIRWGDNFAATYKIQYSNEPRDPKNWTDIYTTTMGRGGIETVDFTGISARNIRVLAMSVNDPRRGVSIRELEIYGERKAAMPERAEPYINGSGDMILCDGNWKIQNAMFTDISGELLSTGAADVSEWVPAVVPGTILGSYLAIGAVPDPYYGDQMSMISEQFFSKNDFWYRNEFTAPSSFRNRRVFLSFDAVNWKSEIYVNGEYVGRIDGAFKRGRFDVSALIRPGKTNYVAVKILRMDHVEPSPSKVTHRYIGSPTTNGDLLGYDSPASLAAAGWNWLPVVRGRNLGIWDEVRLEARGDVELTDPWVVSKLNLPDTTRAELKIMTELKNHSDRRLRGTVAAKIGDITIKKPVELAAGETLPLTLDSGTYPSLAIGNPRLWWPNGYGEQNLYDLELTFEANGKVADVKKHKFGIRELECRDHNGVLFIYVNGHRILLRGGNWGMPEGMMNIDAAGYDLRVKMHRDANFTMIRNWVGMTGDMSFYDACDKYGILVFDDFWLANPVDGPDPLDEAMFMDNARDKIRRVRGRASLALYCGRNEGMPPASLDRAMRDAIAELDGTRHYEPNSAAGLLTGLGPYDIKSQKWYFANRGKTFHSEQGIIAIPVAESIREMMPEEYLWPINDMWALHDYQTPRSLDFTRSVEHRYGIPENVDQYALKAQMLGMESSKAIFESLQNNQGSGMLLWMSQSAWPSFICQLYDHWFEPTSSYFGAKRASEPIHILWNPLNDNVVAANNTIQPVRNAVAMAEIFDLNGRSIVKYNVQLDIGAASAEECFRIELPENELSFIKLRLEQEGKVLSENFYWTEDADESCKELLMLPKVALQASCQITGTEDGLTSLHVTLKNNSHTPALMVRLSLKSADGSRILPVFYSDNYISLMPGDERELQLTYEAGWVDMPPHIHIDGWNIENQSFSSTP